MCRLCGLELESYTHVLMECANLEHPRTVLWEILKREAPSVFHQVSKAKSYFYRQAVLLGGSRKCVPQKQYETGFALVAGFIAEALTRLQRARPYG